MRSLKTTTQIFLVLFYLIISLNVQAKDFDKEPTRVDSLVEIYNKAILSEDKVKQLQSAFDLSELHSRRLRNFKEALLYTDKAIEHEKELNNFEHHADLLFNKAYANDWLSKYQKALEYYDDWLAYNKKEAEPDKGREGEVYGRKASVYKNLGKYEKAYDHQLKSLDVALSLKDTVNIASSYYQLGSLFYYQKQYQKALENYLIAQEYAENIKGGNLVYACLAALGTTYQGLKQPEKSLDYNLQSLEKAQELDYTMGVAYSLSNIGSIYSELEEYEKANEYLIQSVVIKEEMNDKWGLIGTYRSVADLYTNTGKTKEAIVYLEKAFKIAKEIDSKTRQLEILEGFAETHKKMKNYKKALFYQESYTALKDSVLNEKTLEQMGDLKENYEVKQKETEILILTKDNEILETEKERDKLNSYLWTVIACSFGVLMLLFISRYRAQKKSSELLKDKNEEINRQNSQLQEVNALISETNELLEQNKLKIEEQNKALESSNEDLRNFASVASHDLKEPLRMINSYTSILKKKYEGLFDERAHEFMGYVVDGVSRMEQLINSLLDYSRVSIQGQNENLKLISLRDVADVVKGNLRYPIMKNSATVNIENAENFPIVKANHIQMMQLMQNLVSNALKFKGERLPVVTIGFDTKGDTHTFYVKDNGIGISKENQEKIFDMLTRLHTKQEYEGTGIGLATVRKIVERHHGRIWVESVEGEGSTFFFTLPVVKVPEMEMAQS